MKNRLLLISPETPARERILGTLKAEGFEMLLAETGQKALRTIGDHLIDGIVLDYATPFAQYDSATNKAKTLEAITDASPFLPLVLTCKTATELSHAAKLMADIVLVQPVAARALLDAVDTVLEESLRERARRKAASIAVLR